MQHIFKTVATVSVMGTLMACAQMAKPPASQSPGPMGPTKVPTAKAVAPVPVRIAGEAALPPGTSSVEVVYVQGRAAHGLGQLGPATLHYEQVLRLDPRHVGALNALGVIYAQEGRTDEALALFAQAIALAPEAPHLYNNAGYALLRANRLNEAGFQLERAQQLSPGSAQTQQNLVLLAQARRKAADETPAASVEAGDAASHGARLVAVAPQIYELQTAAPRQALQQAKAVQTVPLVQHQPASEKSAAKEERLVNVAHLALLATQRETPVATGAAGETLRGVRLEVANGVGIANLARRTADRLAGTGVIAARLTNARPYRQMKTEIQFGAGQDALAKALQTRLPLTAATTAAQLQGNVQLRLVLGHDLTGRTLSAWLEGRDAQTASLPADATSAMSAGDGWMWG